MKLTIADFIPDTITLNSYEVVIETMAGDGDGYVNIVVGPFMKDQDEPIMQHLIETLSNVAATTPQTIDGKPSLDHVPNFNTWFGSEYYATQEEYDENNTSEVAFEEYVQLQDFLQGFNDETSWPEDPTTDYMFPNTYIGFNIYYYDQVKNKFAVNIDD
jgi:hypothetical protein